MAVQCVYWFNPVIYLMVRQAHKDIEDICDTLTVNGMSKDSKKRYGALILSMASSQTLRHSQLSTCMNGGKKAMKQRFKNILGGGKKRGILLFSVIGVLVVLAAVIININFYSVAGMI